MPRVSPFSGLLFDADRVGALDTVTSPPYDTIAPDQQRRLHDRSPYNVVRLILGREEPGDDASSNKYTRAAARLRAWREEGALVRAETPAWFPYEMRFTYQGEPRRVRGLICEVELEPWGGSIVPHERTMPAPVEDRMSLLREVRANLSPVYALYRGPRRDVADLLEEVTAKPPHAEAVDETGVEHRMWVLADGADISTSLADERLLIADGHHRYTVALAYREEMRKRHGPGAWDAMMMFLVDAATEDPPVLPIHRVVAAASPSAEGRQVRDLAEVLSSVRDDDLTYGTVSLEDGRAVHRVARLDGDPPTVCALHEQLLDDALRRLEVRYVPDAALAEEAVHTGEARMAFLLPPTRVERIRSVIEHGRRLPQKSTYFWPKPRTGFVIRSFD